MILGGSVTRWLSAAGCLVLVLAGCTTGTADPVPSPTTVVFTPVPRATTTPKPPAKFHFTAQQLANALPAAFGTSPFKKTPNVYPPPSDATVRWDPLWTSKVSPEVCRNVIRYRGIPGMPGDFIDPSTPSAAGVATVGPIVVTESQQVSAAIVELPPALGDRLMDQRLPTPPECAHILLDGQERASAVERALPGYGVRARYVVRTFPVGDQVCTERSLQYRTDQYVVAIRLDAVDNPEPAFLAFARQTRDRLAAQLRG
jgi:hypothetical protein